MGRRFRETLSRLRAKSVDAEPYRGRLVPDQGPRVGVVERAVRRSRRPAKPSENRTHKRHKLRPAREPAPQQPTTGYTLRPGGAPLAGPRGQDFRRGFIAGVMVTLCLGTVAVALAFRDDHAQDRVMVQDLATAAMERIRVERATEAPTAEPAPPADGQASPAATRAGAGVAAQVERPHVPTSSHTGTSDDLEGLDTVDVDGRDMGISDLVRAQRHNRKVVERAGEQLRRFGL